MEAVHLDRPCKRRRGYGKGRRSSCAADHPSSGPEVESAERMMAARERLVGFYWGI